MGSLWWGLLWLPGWDRRAAARVVEDLPSPQLCDAAFDGVAETGVGPVDRPLWGPEVCLGQG